MKRILPCIMLLCLIICGCKGSDDHMIKALELRSRLSASGGTSFRANVTADYGDKTYTFILQCKTDQPGTLSFTVLEPESIAGIGGTVSGEGGKLTFDDKVLAFPLLADGEVSPISAPWIVIKTLLGGYISSCSKEDELLLISIDDSYEADALRLDIWLNTQDIPVSADILWQGRRVLSVQIEDFTFL